jgi:uncharacterized protein (DUF305 family)
MRHRHLARSALIALAAALAISGARADDIAPKDPAAAKTTAEAPFLAENAAAMDRMMADMDVKPTGDVDADFVAMMIPHHQGAIDMAQAYLRYGTNEQLKRIAQEIIVDQQQEIAAMRLALGDPLPPSTAAPTQVDTNTPSISSGQNSSSMSSGMSMMNMKMGN